MGFNLLEVIPYMAGGAMISSAVALNHHYGKRVTEPSSSLLSMLSLDSHSKWKSSFVAGMLFAASLVVSKFGFEEIDSTTIKPFESDKLFFKGTGLIQFMLAGFLIGLGTKLAQGGLTKFALYGIPKFNKSSMVATAAILIFGAITATLRSDFTILQGLNVSKKFNEHLDFRLSFLIPLLILGVNLFRNYRDMAAVKDILRSFSFGALLATGMMVAGLGRRHQVLDFLSLNKNWNPALIFVALGAILSNMFLLNFIVPGGSAIIEDAPTSIVTPRMLLGCALFGTGLGISGLTPGSGLLVSPVYLPQIALFFLPLIAAGQLVGGALERAIGGGSKTLKIN